MLYLKVVNQFVSEKKNFLLDIGMNHLEQLKDLFLLNIEIFADKISATSMGFIKIIIKKKRESRLAEIVETSLSNCLYSSSEISNHCLLQTHPS